MQIDIFIFIFFQEEDSHPAKTTGKRVWNPAKKKTGGWGSGVFDFGRKTSSPTRHEHDNQPAGPIGGRGGGGRIQMKENENE